MLCQNLGILFKVRWLILKVPPLGSEPLYLSYCLQCGCDVWSSSSHYEDTLQHKNGSHVWREQRRHVGGAWVLVSVLVLGLLRMLSQSLYFLLLFFNVKE